MHSWFLAVQILNILSCGHFDGHRSVHTDFSPFQSRLSSKVVSITIDEICARKGGTWKTRTEIGQHVSIHCGRDKLYLCSVVNWCNSRSFGTLLKPPNRRPRFRSHP